jgi:SET domain-containing protein
MYGNLYTKEKIANYSHSKRSHEYYKLEGQNLEIYNQTLELTTKAIYPNLVVKESKGKGHGVFTTAPLKPLTLLARYSGVVEMNHLTNMIKNTDQTTHNDIFTLIETKNSKYDRVVNPSSHCNLGRFLNHSKKQSQNVRSIRIVNPNDDMEILLYTCCPVKKGNELLYNYEEMDKSYWKNFGKTKS